MVAFLYLLLHFFSRVEEETLACLHAGKMGDGDVGSNTTLYCKRKDLKRSSLARILVQTEIDIAEWEE